MRPLIHELENRATGAGIEIENCIQLATNQERIQSKIATSKGTLISNMKTWGENYCKIIDPKDLLNFIEMGITANNKIIFDKLKKAVQLELDL